MLVLCAYMCVCVCVCVCVYVCVLAFSRISSGARTGVLEKRLEGEHRDDDDPDKEREGSTGGELTDRQLRRLTILDAEHKLSSVTSMLWGASSRGIRYVVSAQHDAGEEKRFNSALLAVCFDRWLEQRVASTDSIKVTARPLLLFFHLSFWAKECYWIEKVLVLPICTPSPAAVRRQPSQMRFYDGCPDLLCGTISPFGGLCAIRGR
jgi:hypothetical protein